MDAVCARIDIASDMQWSASRVIAEYFQGEYEVVNFHATC